MSWKIHVKTVTGKQITIQVLNPQSATVFEVKKLVSLHYTLQGDSLPTYLQRMVWQNGFQRVKLDDKQKLCHAGLSDGSEVLMIITNPFELYVINMNGRQHTVVVPRSEPQSATIKDITVMVETELGCSLDEYCFQFKGSPIDAVRHGKQMTLKDLSITSGSTLAVLKIGLTLNITNPKVDVCFMVDCTGSMSKHIEAVKNSVKELRDQLVKEYQGCDLKFSFLRYTDYDQPVSSRTTWLDFTNSQDSFHSFVNTIRADGGDDTPEDIMGGLTAAFTNISWRSDCCKVLIHIADAPCHGKRYHSADDKYPEGDPAGISHESMMAEVVRKDIQYWFGYINKDLTDQMIRIFNESLKSQSDQRMIIRQFDAVKPHEVSQAVNRTVSDSVMVNAAAKLAAVRPCSFNPVIPDWTSTSIIEIYGKKTPPVSIGTLSDLQDSKWKLDPPIFDVCFKVAPDPFTEGTESHIYHGYDVNNKRSIILKKFKRSDHRFQQLACYMQKLEIQAIANVYCREFSHDRPKSALREMTIEFSPVDVVQYNRNEFFLWEPELTGTIEKFSTNSGVVRASPHNDLLQAFSHYTWVKSGKTLLVCDLEGVAQNTKITLTDPAIHSSGREGKYGLTDSGYAGIQIFFSTHVCGAKCMEMGLDTQKL